METKQIISEIVEHFKSEIKKADWENNWGDQTMTVSIIQDLSNGFCTIGTMVAYGKLDVDNSSTPGSISLEVEDVDVSINVFDQNEHRIIFPNKGVRVRSTIENKLKKYLQP